MTTLTNYLLDAVQKLTRSSVSKVPQEQNGELEWTRVEHAPLLLQLRTAVAGGTGAHAGASTSGRERIPLNTNALAIWDPIVSRINEWYLATERPREETAITTRLMAWYLEYENRRRAGQVDRIEERATELLVSGWVRQIESLFDPPIRFEVTSVVAGRDVPVPCPVCGERYALDPASGDRVTALVVEYRNLGAQTIEKANAVCRFCEEMWRGSSGIRALSWALENAGEHALEFAGAKSEERITSV